MKIDYHGNLTNFPLSLFLVSHFLIKELNLFTKFIVKSFHEIVIIFDLLITNSYFFLFDPDSGSKTMESQYILKLFIQRNIYVKMVKNVKR